MNENQENDASSNEPHLSESNSSEFGQPEKNPYLIPAAIIIAGAIIAGALYFSLNPRAKTGENQNDGKQAQVQGQLVDISVGTLPVLGEEKAPVVMIEFSDFQCPFCGRHFSQTEPQIIEKYVKTGKVRLAYRDFAFLDAIGGIPPEQGESHLASVAARCANEQGKFWDYHNYLFRNQKGENQGAFSVVNLKKFAQTLGLDMGNFNSCFDSLKYLEQVKKDTTEGQDAGVSGTPSFFIGRSTGGVAVDIDALKIQLANRQSIIKLANGSVVIVGAVPFTTIDQILKEMVQ